VATHVSAGSNIAAVRNETAHEYGEQFAERTLVALSQFVADAEDLVEAIEEGQDDSPLAP